MIKTVLLVPTRDNAGRPFARSLWRELEQRLLQFGGLSETGTVAGAWVSEGRVYRDVSRRYEVALASWRQLPAWLEVAEWARVAFRQEAVYIDVAGVPEILEGG